MDNSNNQDQTQTNQEKVTKILDLTSLINRYLTSIDQLKQQLKEQKNIFNDVFDNDKEYHDESEKVKAIIKQKSAIKQRIVKQPAVESVTTKIKGLQQELKDAQSSLSSYLQEYYRNTGNNTIENDQGEILEIVPIFKVVKRKSE